MGSFELLEPLVIQQPKLSIVQKPFEATPLSASPSFYTWTRKATASLSQCRHGLFGKGGVPLNVGPMGKFDMQYCPQVR
eukprot:12911530-Prorocentrum_lima.AAC.1